MINSLKIFFEPKSIAVVGASERQGSIGRAIMVNLLERFKGKIYPINIKYDTVFGLKCYKSILEVPEPIDIAVVAVPAPIVPQVAEECGKKRVKGLIVISAGFKEIGGEGIEREQKLLEVVKKYGMRMIGPNCLGIY
ncbi:MAG TPA: CoA-binding protein, partial [Ignisphaera sp.]|nr:CoA-binding protein [Ignisphaera sp.]